MRPVPRRGGFGPDEVRALLPQRDPLVFVDRVVGVRLSPDPALLAERDLDASDPVFAAHFPGRPLWPGVLVVEGLAQSAQLLLLLLLRDGAPGPGSAAAGGGTGVLTDVAVRFHRPVPPAVTLAYRVDLIGWFGAAFRVAVDARVGRTSVAAGTIGVAVLPDDRAVEPG